MSERIIIKTLGLIRKSSGYWLYVNTFVMAGRSLFPLAGVFLLKRLVDSVMVGVTSPGGVMVSAALWMIAAVVMILLADDLFVIFSRYSVRAQAARLEEHIMGTIHAQASTLGLKALENPSFHEMLSRAANDASWRPASVVGNILLILRGVLSFAAMAVVLSRFSILLAAVLPLAFIPVFFSKAYGTRRLYQSRLEQAPLARKASYFSWLVTAERPAREVKLFGLGRYFDSLFKRYFSASKETELRAIRKSSMSEVAASVVKAALIAGVLITLIMTMSKGTITAGELAMYLVACRQAMVYLRDAFTGTSGLREDRLFLGDYFAFVGQKNDTAVAEPAQELSGTRPVIEMADVTFTYNDGSTPAVKHVSLKINEGEKVAIAGANGSGKSTIVKLLCRLYDPDEGTITYSGTNIIHFRPEEYRKMFSVVFQDFMLYYLTARENITISDIDSSDGGKKLEAACAAAGLGTLFASVPEGYDMLLGHMDHGGRELSWGEWQKIAIARALYRQAPVLILDEPSSSLDADSEYDIFSRLGEITRGRTTIFISHRLSNIMAADRIILLDGGEVAESGTHDELMALRGKYFNMYTRQKSMYR